MDLSLAVGYISVRASYSVYNVIILSEASYNIAIGGIGDGELRRHTMYGEC